MASDNSALQRRALAALILAESERGGGHGMRLPTERQLAHDLGVSRAAIRHAMAVLQAEGRVSRARSRRRGRPRWRPGTGCGRDRRRGSARQAGRGRERAARTGWAVRDRRLRAG